ncbi:MAG: XRE family transcriptional regulator [Bacteroidota bacterium]
MMGARIKQARIAAGMSLRDLADRTNNYISAQAIHKYELGKSVPSSEVLLQLGKALDVKVEFFFRSNKTEIELGEPAYRKGSAVSEKELQSIRAKVKDHLEKYLELESFFPDNRFERPSRPKSSKKLIRKQEDIELTARKLRKEWKLGIDPIEQPTEVLEDRGIKMIMLDADKDFDGLSCWANRNIPVIVVRKNQKSDRLRFSIMHELGHLLLRTSKAIDAEKAANRFAGAFLVPKEAVLAELGENRHKLSLYELKDLRQKYGMSVQAWIYRAHDLAIISNSLYRQLFAFLRSKGLRDQELGVELPVEEPRRFERLAIQAVEEDLISDSKGAELLGIPLTKFRQKLGDESVNNAVHS